MPSYVPSGSAGAKKSLGTLFCRTSWQEPLAKKSRLHQDAIVAAKAASEEIARAQEPYLTDWRERKDRKAYSLTDIRTNARAKKSLGPIDDQCHAYAFTGEKIVGGKNCHLRVQESPAKKSRATSQAMWRADAAGERIASAISGHVASRCHLRRNRKLHIMALWRAVATCEKIASAPNQRIDDDEAQSEKIV